MPNTAYLRFAETRIPLLGSRIHGFPNTTHVIGTAKNTEPTEDGSLITDHSSTQPEGLRLLGWVSDMNFGGEPGAAWDAIRRLNQAKTPLTIITEYGTYNNQLITRAEALPQGRGASIRLELQQIIRVGSPTNDLPRDQTSGPANSRPGETARGRISPLII